MGNALPSMFGGSARLDKDFSELRTPVAGGKIGTQGDLMRDGVCVIVDDQAEAARSTGLMLQLAKIDKPAHTLIFSKVPSWKEGMRQTVTEIVKIVKDNQSSRMEKPVFLLLDLELDSGALNKFSPQEGSAIPHEKETSLALLHALYTELSQDPNKDALLKKIYIRFNTGISEASKYEQLIAKKHFNNITLKDEKTLLGPKCNLIVPKLGLPPTLADFKCYDT